LPSMKVWALLVLVLTARLTSGASLTECREMDKDKTGENLLQILGHFREDSPVPYMDTLMAILHAVPDDDKSEDSCLRQLLSASETLNIRRVLKKLVDVKDKILNVSRCKDVACLEKRLKYFKKFDRDSKGKKKALLMSLTGIYKQVSNKREKFFNSEARNATLKLFTKPMVDFARMELTLLQILLKATTNQRERYSKLAVKHEKYVAKYYRLSTKFHEKVDYFYIELTEAIAFYLRIGSTNYDRMEKENGETKNKGDKELKPFLTGIINALENSDSLREVLDIPNTARISKRSFWWEHFSINYAFEFIIKLRQ